MTELIIQSGKHQGKKIDLAGTDCLIGRHESCKIRIASSEVSKTHCRLKHKKGGVHAKDLGSRNGTYVNDELLTEEVLLKPGDTLRVGPMTFLIAEGKAAKATKKESEKPAKQTEAAESAETSKSAPSNKPIPESADDDLIASWLSEGGDFDKTGDDTTVVLPSPVQSSPQSSEADSSEGQNDSVSDQAKEIILRWQQKHGKG